VLAIYQGNIATQAICNSLVIDSTCSLALRRRAAIEEDRASLGTEVADIEVTVVIFVSAVIGEVR